MASREQVMQRFRHSAPAAFVFGASFGLYMLTLCPTVYVGDSAEFITNAFTLGINHPTGYPLYTILTRFWLLVLPIGTPAFTVNAFSAFAAAGTVVCVYFILELLTARRIVAVLLALLLAVSSTLWSRATSAEVYSLSSFFFALTAYLVLRWHRDHELKMLAVAAYVAGLGLSQHSTGVLTAFCFLLFVLLTEPAIVRNARSMTVLAILFLIGLSTYLYLPIRALANPPIVWGEMGSIDGVFRHFLPVSGKGLAPYLGGNTGGQLSWITQQVITREFWYFGVLALFGIPVLIKRWRLLALFVSVITINVLFAVSRNMPLHADFDAYFIPTYVTMVILMGLGLVWITETVGNRWRKMPGYVIQAGFPTALLLVVATTAYANFSRNDKSRNFFGQDFGQHLYQPIEQNAIVFTIGDEETFLGWYAKHVEKIHPGVSFVDTRLLGTPWGIRLSSKDLRLPLRESDPPDIVAAQIIRSTIQQRPVYFTHRLPWRFLSTEYDMLPTGMLIQILPKGSPREYRAIDFGFRPGWEETALDERCRLLVDFYPKGYVDRAQFWLNQRNERAAQAELKKFFGFPLRAGIKDAANAYLLQSLIDFRSGLTTRAIAYADSALALNPSQWQALEYRGNFRFALKDTAGAVADWEASLRLNPGNTTIRANLEGVKRNRTRR